MHWIHIPSIRVTNTNESLRLNSLTNESSNSTSNSDVDGQLDLVDGIRVGTILQNRCTNTETIVCKGSFSSQSCSLSEGVEGAVLLNIPVGLVISKSVWYCQSSDSQKEMSCEKDAPVKSQIDSRVVPVLRHTVDGRD